MAQHAHGIDLRDVVTDSERNRKSIGIERTFNQNLFDENTALTKLRSYSRELEKSYKWIARDKNGRLYIYDTEPYKDEVGEVFTMKFGGYHLFDKCVSDVLFKNGTWENKEG